MYDLSKAYRSMQKSIANRRVEDWEASNGHIKDTSNGSWRQGIKGGMTCTVYVALVW